MPSQFINAKENLVTEAIDGLLRAAPDRLARLDGYPHIKVVTQRNVDKSKVALISGGGSGHEPAHAGFVGPGLLTAAVCGEVFASPSVEAVLAAILAVTGPNGCLLIVKNYTGDRLNFGLAAERARALGKRVSMVVVADDIALPDLPQPRGVAGTLFVHKIAGAYAEQGYDLATVTAVAEAVVARVLSIGMSLDTCTVPGSPKEQRLADGEAELGLGIHGEPGVERIAFESAAQAVQITTDRLAAKLEDGQEYIALINNLGGATPLEMSVIANELARSAIGDRIKGVIGPAPMMTSLDMRGFSISLLPATEAEQLSLAAPVAAAAWPGLTPFTTPVVQPLPAGMEPATFTASADPATRALFEKACAILIAEEAALNALDAKQGDGDTGSTLATAARTMQASLDQLPFADTAALFTAVGQQLSQSMGGSSGVLLAIFFSAAGDAARGGADAISALRAGLARIQAVGGAELGDRTMVDALSPALEMLDKSVDAAAIAARAGAEATARMTRAKAGRAAYVSADQLNGVPDPGAEAVARLLAGLAD